MIDPEHDQAQALAIEAAAAKQAGDVRRAATLYHAAAQHEARALAAVAAGKPRTTGILAVSLAALQFKAGDLDAAAETCLRYLERADLPDRSRAQLEEILRAASTPSVVS